MVEFSQTEKDEWARQVLSGDSATVAQSELRLRLGAVPKATEEPEPTTAADSTNAPDAGDLDG
jgi:hypothetical protein